MKADYLVIGAGAWGTALALHLAHNRRRVLLWSRDAEHTDALETDKENKKYLPGFPFPESLMVSRHLLEDLHQVERILFAVPSHAFREILEYCVHDYPKDKGIIWATKGLDPKTGKLLGSVVDEILGPQIFQVLLTGPSFAQEVARAEPTEVNLATNHLTFAEAVQDDFDSPRFKTLIIQDLLGAEIGGAVKNVVSICVGIADGLGYGMNTKAMLMNKGVHEMQRFAKAIGAQAFTLLGPCGLGDLILTCSDNQSRNRRFGVMIGQGHSASESYQKIGQVVEGVKTASTLYHLAKQEDIYAPITLGLYHFLEKLSDSASLSGSLKELAKKLIEDLLKS
jgi:glycerol-3-phosphate dehydrogenase (NAD(P)+)